MLCLLLPVDIKLVCCYLEWLSVVEWQSFVQASFSLLVQIFFPTLILIRRVGRFLVGEITTGVSGCNVHALLSKENDLKDEK